MISLVDFIAVLQIAWQTVVNDEVPTQFPGVSLDVARLASWFEFWVTHTFEPPQRVPGRESLRVLIDVHCYSRLPEKRQVFEMADRVREVLAHQTFPLASTENVDLTQGTLRTREAIVRDLTRESITEPRLPLQHVVVSLTGSAEREGNRG